MPTGLARQAPRSVREAQAYRAFQVGAVSATAAVLTLVLAVVGAIGDALPVIFILLTILCAARFAMVTGISDRRR